MRISLLLFLLLPLHSFAQFGPGYTGPTMQQNQQSRQDFNRMTNQRTQDFNQRAQDHLSRMGEANRASGAMRPMTPEEQRQAQAKQQQAKQEATEKLAHLVQEQQRRRQEHPAKNPQQAAAQQKEDDKQLNLLGVKNYRDFFLADQISNAVQARQLTPKAQQTLKSLSVNLLSDAWWRKQEGAQLAEKVKAYSDSLTSLTAGLLGFDLASPPPTPAQLAASQLDALLAKGTFDQQAATEIIQGVALAEKLIAGRGLAEAVMNFKSLNSNGAASQELQSDPKKLQKEVSASLRRVNTEMQHYNARIVTLARLSAAQNALFNSTSNYLAKNGN
ncbi:MAG: hypothetical protein M3Y54_05330 [Bacteroidota bacterium]|nr:hypothetical protein [Bacteroidota bacterium]